MGQCLGNLEKQCRETNKGIWIQSVSGTTDLVTLVDKRLIRVTLCHRRESFPHLPRNGFRDSANCE
ncbi:hypothetical protein D9M72_315280 [compost metagenome]